MLKQLNCTYFDKTAIEKFNDRADLGAVYYVNSDALKAIDNAKKELSDILAEYGQNDAISVKINELEKMAKSVKDARTTAAERIDKAKGIEGLLIDEDNKARAHAFHVSGKYRKLRDVKTDNSKETGYYQGCADTVRGIIVQIVERAEKLEDVKGRDKDWLKIATKGECKTVQNCLANMAFTLYGANDKFKGNDVLYAIIASIKTKDGKYEVYSANKTQKAMLEVVNLHVLGEKDDDKDK